MMKPFEYVSKAGKKSMIVDLKHMGMFEEVEVTKKFDKTYEQKTLWNNKELVSYNTQVVIGGVDCYITFTEAQNRKWLEMPTGKVLIKLDQFEVEEDGKKRKQKMFVFESLETVVPKVEPNVSVPVFDEPSLPPLDERKKAVYDHYKDYSCSPDDKLEFPKGNQTTFREVLGAWCDQ